MPALSRSRASNASWLLIYVFLSKLHDMKIQVLDSAQVLRFGWAAPVTRAELCSFYLFIDSRIKWSVTQRFLAHGCAEPKEEAL